MYGHQNYLLNAIHFKDFSINIHYIQPLYYQINMQESKQVLFNNQNSKIP